jgi:hypothetical protein
MANHTPAPWSGSLFVSASGDYKLLITAKAPDGFNIQTVADVTHGRQKYNEPRNTKIEANASLLLAAVDMRAFIEKLTTPRDFTSVDAANAFIQRAADDARALVTMGSDQ